MSTEADPVRLESLEYGAVWRVVLATPKDVGEGFVQHCFDTGFLVNIHIAGAKVKVDRATLKMELDSGGESFVRSCTIALERTATADPGAPGCAP